MYKTLYFIVGDIAANSLTGALCAVLGLMVAEQSWPMPLAMTSAMLIGMFSAMTLCMLLFIGFFGAMEVMLPTMLSGMVAAMLPIMHPAETLALNALQGAMAGLLVIALVWLANRLLRGVKRYD